MHYLLKQVMIVLICSVSGLTAIAQGAEKLTLDLEEYTLSQLFEELEKQADVEFAYSSQVIQDRRTFSLTVENQSLKTVLNDLAKQAGFEYKISGKKVSVKLLEKQKVTGKVLDVATGEPLVGVTVMVMGTSQGTITDIDGTYNLTTYPNGSLLFSFVGFANKEVAVSGRSEIVVSLEEGSLSLEEVVVTAIGIERETRALGYSVTKVDSKNINRGGSPNLATTLAGKVPGLQLTRSSGVMGSSRIVLRGEASLNLDKNQALIVVDGVPVTNQQNGDGEISYLGSSVDYGDGLSAINPADIEDITVLKGASAAALYGSQAANGVIMITTKKGSFNQDLTVNLRHQTSWQSVNRWLPRQTQFGSGNRSENDYYAFKDSPDGPRNRNGHSWGPKFMGQEFYQYDSPHSAIYDPATRDEIWEYEPGGQTPWESHEIEQNFYETGITNTTGVSVQAGDGNAYFRGSADYLTNKYIMPNTGYQRLNVSLSSGVKAGNSQFSTKINYVNQASDNLPSEGYDRQNAHYQVFWLNANDDLNWFKNKQWLDGQENIQQNKITALSANPYWILYNSINTLDKDRVFGKVQFDHKFSDNFRLMARTGVDFFAELRTRERAWSEPRNAYGKYEESTLKTLQLNTDVLVSHDRKLGDVALSGSLGFNHRYTGGNGIYTEGRNLIIPGVFNLDNAEEDPWVNTARRGQELVSGYGLINANWRETIFLDITGRNDWTSTLPAGNNSYFYPSAALAADLTEMFHVESRSLSFLKLRASAAQVGSDTDPYRLNRYYTASGTINGGYSNPSTLPNPELKPERTNSYELGLDAHFFNHRLNFDATFYKSVTKDQILSLPVDPASGYLSAMMNAGSVSNRGIELQLDAKPFMGNDFGWDVSANWSTNRGMVEELVPGVIDTYILGSYVSSRVLVKAEPGDELGKIYGKGYDRHNGEIIFKDGLAQRDNEEDFLGNVFPDWRAGFINSFRYKRFNLSFQFDYQHGGKAYSITHFLMNYTGKSTKTVYGRESGAPYESGAEYDMASGKWLENQDGRFGVIGDGVMLDEESGEYVKNNVSAPAPYFYNSMYERDQIEGNVHETTFLKLRDLRLTYSFPAVFGLKGGSVAVFGNDLFIWTDFPSYDPELSVVSNGVLTPGLEAVGSPSTRTIGVELKISL
ncbi:SusC/RagA family TonB-linked outer membrane protein [Marinoscillum furvescens]|uniref:TonB-linked SusC/RagA family outer membrane protein n=1 Tax=Marinoscillum furvescens DSM 4134 TaxID=1122208 RepID=A0A3D9KZG1_MARFU|nr:SusC/RagA family TonB-linked outer membrane protein [Marinoscillum furvescens]RED93215.1 TonB-linked SusC/RagA family outer membrane protein [Marinoscillum furvescens DSM 4134]